MSTYGESYSKVNVDGKQMRYVCDQFAERFPMISQVFAGIYSDDGKVCQVPPASIVIFAEAGKLKFCLTPKHGNRVAFGTVEDPLAGLSGVEAALAGGSYEWKIKR
jgi:hypothetical protein